METTAPTTPEVNQQHAELARDILRNPRQRMKLSAYCVSVVLSDSQPNQSGSYGEQSGIEVDRMQAAFLGAHYYESFTEIVDSERWPDQLTIDPMFVVDAASQFVEQEIDPLNDSHLQALGDRISQALIDEEQADG